MRRLHIRQVGVVGLVVALGLVAACGDGGDDGDDSAQTPAPEETEGSAEGTDGATEEEAGGEPVTLVVWDDAPVGGKQDAYAAIDEAYMAANPNVTIEHEHFPVDTWETKLRAAIAAGQGPDVVKVFPGLFGASNFAQGLQPLTAYVDELPEEERGQIQGLDAAPAPDGEIYAVPEGQYAYVMIYNKDLFEQAGLDPEAPPETFDELLDACGALAAADIVPISAGWKDGYYLEFWTYVWGRQLLGEDQFDQWKALEFPMDSPEFEIVYTTVLEMQEAGCFSEDAIGLDTFTDTVGNFNSGRAGMYLWYQPPDQPLMEESFGDAETVDVFLPPQLEEAAWPYPSTDAGPTNGIAITKWSENADAAWEYVRYRLSAEAQLVIWELAAEYPSNNTVEITADYPPYQNYLDILALEDNHTLFLGLPVAVTQVLYQQSQPLISGDLPVPDLLEQLEVERAAEAENWP